MASLNKVCLIGNLGKDPEMRFLPSGDPVANFSLAVNESWKGKDGERHEKVEWIAVEVLGPLAKIVGDYCQKGKQVYLEGSLTTQEWEKDGVKHTKTKVKLSGPKATLVLLGGGGRGREEGGQSIKDHEYKYDPRKSDPGDFQVSDDDVPFAVLLPLIGAALSVLPTFGGVLA